MSEPQAGNGYDRDRANQVIEAIEAKRAEIRRLKQKAAASIAPEVASLSADIGIQLKQAKKAWGLNTTTLKAQLKVRELQRKQNEVVEALDEDTQEDLVKLRTDLGPLADLPMGQWFLASRGDADAAEWDAAAPQEAPAKTKRKAERKALHDELDAMGDDAADAVVAENVTRLRAGIKKTQH